MSRTYLTVKSIILMFQFERLVSSQPVMALVRPRISHIGAGGQARLACAPNCSPELAPSRRSWQKLPQPMPVVKPLYDKLI